MNARGRASLPRRDGQGRLDRFARGAVPGVALAVAAVLASSCSGEQRPAGPREPTELATPAPGAAPPDPDGATPDSETPEPPGPEAQASPAPTQASPAPTPVPDDEFGTPELIGTFDSEVVPGASGLATSERNPEVRYLLDDRPGTGEVWVLRADGSLRGAIPVAGLDALDTESLSVAPCGADDTRSCVYVGDVGDNLRTREDVRVYRFPEPDLSDSLPDEPVPADAAVLTYPGEPEDAEAMLVDADGVPHLVSKAPFDSDSGQTGPTRLYAAERFGDGELREVGELDLPPPAQPLLSLVAGDVVTGGSVGPDGRVLLRTYDHVLVGTPPDADAPLETLPGWTFEEAPTPLLPQAEAIAWAADGCGYDLVSERVGDVWHVPCLTG